MNWVLGHLAEHRDKMLRALDLDLLMMPDQAARYARGSDPIIDPSGVLHLDQITHYLITAKETLANTLNTASEAYLLEVTDQKSGRTRLQRVQGLVWHETYHLGQLEILRQLAGMNDKII